MRHRIAVLGAGYAGTAAAGHLARHLHPGDVEITVVNAEPDFVERIRLHQVAAGRPVTRRPLADLFAGTGVRILVGRVTALDPVRRTVTVAGGDGDLGYDTLLHNLGSTTAPAGRHVFGVGDRPSAQALSDRLDRLDPGAVVLVVGGNLTGIEVATEIAESRPGLRVALATRGEVGGRLSPGARRHLRRAFDRLGITRHEHTTVLKANPAGVVTAGGGTLAADVTVWAAGFAVASPAAASGLEVTDERRIVVDRQMRSVSHPGVYAAGDSAHVIGENGLPLPMTCASAGFTRMQATAAIVGDLTGARIGRTALPYYGNCISLGTRDGIFQAVDASARSRPWSVRGLPAVALKNLVYAGTVWNQNNPTYGLPVRRRRLPAAVRPAAAVAG